MCFSQFTVVTSGGGISCVMLLLSSLLLCLQQACGSLGFLAQLYLVSGSTLVLDRRTHTPHPARPCHPRGQCCRLLWAREGWLGLWAHQLPFHFTQHWKKLGPGWMKILQIVGTSQVCSLQTDARPWGLRTAVSEHRTLESWAGDAEPSPNRQQKGPVKGGLAQQVQHKGHCKSLESSMALKNVPAERQCSRESWENKTPGQAYSSWGLLWTNCGMRAFRELSGWWYYWC